MSRPRLIETGKFRGCRDQDSSRLENLVVVETETDRDLTKVVETETLTRVSSKSRSRKIMSSLDQSRSQQPLN